MDIPLNTQVWFKDILHLKSSDAFHNSIHMTIGQEKCQKISKV
jgi:hypothetical protein